MLLTVSRRDVSVQSKITPSKNGENPPKDEKGSYALEKGTKENSNGKRKQEKERSSKEETALGLVGNTSGCRAKSP